MHICTYVIGLRRWDRLTGAIWAAKHSLILLYCKLKMFSYVDQESFNIYVFLRIDQKLLKKHLYAEGLRLLKCI